MLAGLIVSVGGVVLFRFFSIEGLENWNQCVDMPWFFETTCVAFSTLVFNAFELALLVVGAALVLIGVIVRLFVTPKS